MAAPRNETQRLKDRAEVADLYLRGMPQYKIAEQLGVHPSTVHRDLIALREQWQESANMLTGEWVALELAKIDALETEYWDAWVRSCKEVKVTRLKSSGKPKRDEDGNQIVNNPHVENVVETSQPVGDPRFLSGVKDCIKMRRDLLGLDEPAKFHHEVYDWRADAIADGVEDPDAMLDRLVEDILKDMQDNGSTIQ